MNELDDIKSRAAKRRLLRHSPYEQHRAKYLMQTDEAEADLDRAIVIAEGTQEAFNLMMDERVNVATGREKELERERDEARAAALMLRDIFDSEGNAFASNVTEVLAVTEWLEAYR